MQFIREALLPDDLLEEVHDVLGTTPAYANSTTSMPVVVDDRKLE